MAKMLGKSFLAAALSHVGHNEVIAIPYCKVASSAHTAATLTQTHTHTRARSVVRSRTPSYTHCHIENFKLKKLFCAQVKKFRIKN